MPRLAPFAIEAVPDEHREAVSALLSGPPRSTRGPYGVWLRSPRVAEAAGKLTNAVRFQTVLSGDLRELAILVTVRHWRAQYAFWAHIGLAREAGLADEIIEAIRAGVPPSFTSESQRLVADFVSEYLDTHRIGDLTYSGAVGELGEEGVVELVALVGLYGMVAATLNVFDVSVLLATRTRSPDGRPRSATTCCGTGTQ